MILAATIRIGGFANSHYRSGRSRVVSGKIIRMYQANSRRLVLLPPKNDGTAVLVETRAPEAFVDEVQRKWNRYSRVLEPPILNTTP